MSFPESEDRANPNSSIEEFADQWEHEMPPVAGPLANVISAVVVGVIGLGGIAGSLALGLGTPAEPGSGMWPFSLSIAVVSLAAALTLFARRITDSEKFTHHSWAVVGGTASLVGLVLLVPVIGFEIPSLLLTFIWLRFLGKETWRLSTLLSFIVVAAFYVTFIVLLGVPLPHLF